MTPLFYVTVTINVQAGPSHSAHSSTLTLAGALIPLERYAQLRVLGRVMLPFLSWIVNSALMDQR